MAEAQNPIANALMAQSFGLTGDQQKKLMASQQQQAMAQALMQQGMTPIDTSNRQIGGVGYAISPLEGVAKLAQGLVGGYEQKQANENYVNALTPQGGSGQSSTSNGGNMWINADGTPSTLANMQIMQGNRAAAEAVQMALKERNATISDPMVSATINGQEGMYSTSVVRNASLGGHDVQFNPPQQAAAPSGDASGQMPTSPQPTPVQGGYPLPPPGNTPELAAARQAMGITQQPPVDQQLASNVPPVSSSALMPPANMGTPNPGAGASIPAPAYGKTILTPQQQSALEIQKANAIAQGAVQPAGAKAEAEKMGDTAAEANKTLAVMSANLPVLQQRIADMTKANQASSFGPWNDKEGDGIVSAYHDARNDPSSVANAQLQQKTAQNVLPELGPALAQAGIKGNKFLETLSSTASGVDLSKGKDARQQQIDGLLNNYVQNMKSTYQQVKQYGGNPTTIFPDPPSVANAVKLGVIPREEGISILQNNHGFQ